jgi:hypothetical protein
MKIEWKKVITGVVLAFILLLVFAFATVNPSFGFFGFAIAIMYVGYAVGGDLKNGVVHGALTGMVFIIICMSILMFASGYLEWVNLTAYYLLTMVIGGFIVSAGCGLVGSLFYHNINKKSEDMNIKWKTLIIGVIIAFILAYTIPLIPFFTGLGEIGAFMGFVIATVYVGYAVGADFKNGALNGMLVGIIISLISEIQVLIYNGVFLGLTNEMVSYLLYVVIFYAIAGAIAGFIGSLIKRSRTPKGNTASD